MEGAGLWRERGNGPPTVLFNVLHQWRPGRPFRPVEAARRNAHQAARHAVRLDPDPVTLQTAHESPANGVCMGPDGY